MLDRNEDAATRASVRELEADRNRLATDLRRERGSGLLWLLAVWVFGILAGLAFAEAVKIGEQFERYTCRPLILQVDPRALEQDASHDLATEPP